MGKTMKAAVVRELGKPLAIEEVPVPQPNENQILVRIAATGICHRTSTPRRAIGPSNRQTPFIPGHEGVGTVVAIGRAVRGVKEGDRVGIPWLHTACGHCPHCRHRMGDVVRLPVEQRLLRERQLRGICALSRHHIGHPPSNLEWGPAAPVLCAGVTVYKGLMETEVRPGEWVVISGIGGLGHMAVQYAKAMGMHVAAVDVHPESSRSPNRSAPRSLSTRTAADVAAEMQKLTGGAHGALVTAVSPKAFEQAFDMLRPRGTMALVGLPPGKMSLPIFNMVLKRITVRGSIVGTRQDLARGAGLRGRRRRLRPLLLGQSGEHQRHLRAHGRRQDRRPHRREPAMTNQIERGTLLDELRVRYEAAQEPPDDHASTSRASRRSMHGCARRFAGWKRRSPISTA